MKLEFKKFGIGKPLVILHGLYGSGDNWFSIARTLMDKRTIYLVDQRNHGLSPHHPSINYDLLTADLEQFFTDQGIESAALLGHSMGGKVAMNFALKNPKLVECLIVVDIAPRSYAQPGNFAPQTLQHQSILNTLKKLDISGNTDRTSVDTQLAQSFPEKSLRQFLLKNLKRSEMGTFYWGINIEALQENLLQLMDGIKTNNLIFPKSVLVLRGSQSGYISDKDYSTFTQLFPAVQFISFDTGHWVHAEKPLELTIAIQKFLETD